MLLYKCDFCNKDTNDNIDIYGYNIGIFDNLPAYRTDYENFKKCKRHICFSCYEKIIEWLNHKKGS